MNLTQQIEAEDRRHEEAKERLKAEFARLMGELPDNPRIQRLSPQCFVISSKDMGTATWGKWGAEAHDFKAQYRVLLGLLDNVPLSQGIERIKEALEKESVRIRADMSSHQFPLHPDVISSVRGLLASV